jgi:hypothetical protein
MRLSMALGDLRIALATYATREEQPMHERLYFVRVTSQHVREVVGLLDPKGEKRVYRRSTSSSRL